jgi:hypothetical protein
MNRKQRLIVVAASVVAIMLFLWPPCKHNQLGGWERHRFVFDLGDYHVYITKLAVYLGLVILVGLGLLWVFAERDKIR